MKTTTTAARQGTFNYIGNSSEGVELVFKTTKVKIPSQLIQSVLDHFNNKTIIGGFSMTEPPMDGLGYYIREYAKSEFNRSLSPRYASHLSAVLRDEGLLKISKDGRNTILIF